MTRSTIEVTASVSVTSVSSAIARTLFVAALITIVPVVVLFIAIERHLVAGLTAGSVK
ncbi:hypothetical protein [Actinoplanes sp. ATCC 53533]|uniref:hypothetical protein n=1 Tax=Actinoplanes sp. ATCC 53533 TaxID=1288362 RepID=UPI0018F3871D|nr:hypothetical protein [Actinoplanes sp. ATCC 53533]